MEQAIKVQVIRSQKQAPLRIWFKPWRGLDFLRDLVAGITVGIVALPLAMAFAIASGVKPEAGIFTAVVAGFIISALGGTRVSIGGPTGAFIVILYGIHAKYGAENLAICTVMAGIILFVQMSKCLATGQAVRLLADSHAGWKRLKLWMN